MRCLAFDQGLKGLNTVQFMIGVGVTHHHWLILATVSLFAKIDIQTKIMRDA